jgi:hypothetical protein
MERDWNIAMETRTLNPGEVLCPLCDGKGYYVQKNLPDKIYYFKELNVECPTCYGLGKLDWIEAIVGKRKPNLGVVFDFKTEYMCTFEKENNHPFSNKIMKEAAENIANKVDKEILDILTKKVAMEQKIILEPGEMVCSKCNGRGSEIRNIQSGFKTARRRVVCQKCGGLKKIDWIQNATGANKRGMPGLYVDGFDISVGSSEDEIPDPKVFKIEDCDPDELNMVYLKIVENLNR